MKIDKNKASGTSNVPNEVDTSSYLYARHAPNWGPRLSLTVAILAKGRCFFGPLA
jgi:hypothetical protein